MSGPGPSLVLLAAGLGTRFGGLKQLEAVGPGGATLMDYSVFDARRAGFTDVVLIVRPDMDEVARELVRRYHGLEVRTVHQRLEDAPGSAAVQRVKPWGTAHALIAAAGVAGPFAVANADDFYGERAFRAVAEFLRTRPLAEQPPAWAVVGYPLKDTVSASGGVSRAVIRTDENGWLAAIDEVTGIVADGSAFIGRGQRGTVTLKGDEPVSMNLWAFTPALFDELRRGFAAFLSTANLDTDEYLLPIAMEETLRQRAARVRVLAAGSTWFGLTHQGDRPVVERALRDLVARGAYPERLW